MGHQRTRGGYFFFRTGEGAYLQDVYFRVVIFSIDQVTTHETVYIMYVWLRELFVITLHKGMLTFEPRPGKLQCFSMCFIISFHTAKLDVGLNSN